jgi:PAS domain S-box-containing protein
MTLDAAGNPFLMRVLRSRNSLLISDTAAEAEWGLLEEFAGLRSWLCVPLVASHQVLGLLSLGDSRTQALRADHLRLAQSLAIPAAVAIQNARLYERAEIYGYELERRLADLEVAQKALALSEEGRTLSEERFRRVFRSSPVPFSITTVEEGRFVDVNRTFERHYGYLHDQLVGRTMFEVGLWDQEGERERMIQQIREQGRVSDRIARFRRNTGELVDTLLCAEIVELEGRECLLLVSVDLSGRVTSERAPGRKAAAPS